MGKDVLSHLGWNLAGTEGTFVRGGEQGETNNLTIAQGKAKVRFYDLAHKVIFSVNNCENQILHPFYG